MTVAIAVKVFDGIVLAADSATTLELGPAGHQVYNSADKIFHLHRRLPVGAMTWGLGNVGSASIATLAKDLRRRLMGKDPSFVGWKLDRDAYTVEEVVDRLVELVFDELYEPEFTGQQSTPLLGFLVAGYSAGSGKSEAWSVQIDSATVRPVPTPVAGVDDTGWMAYAQPEATVRLFKGMDPQVAEILARTVPAADLPNVMAALADLERPVVVPPMPFADAVKFAAYVVDTTVGYRRYVLGPDTVGGQVEVAGISRHEGFKWISRKHYYPPTLNPKDPNHGY